MVLLLADCGLINFDQEIPALKYPSDFKKTEINDDTILLNTGKGLPTVMVLFDTAKKEVKLKKWYEYTGNLGSAEFSLRGKAMYGVFDNDYYGDFVKIDLSTGRVLKIPFYDDYGIYYGFVDDVMYLESGIGKNSGKHRLYNTAANTFVDKASDWALSSYIESFTSNASKYFLTASDGFINIDTGIYTDINTLLEGAYPGEIHLVKMEENNDLNNPSYYLIEGYRNDYEESCWGLYRITSIEPAVYEKIDEFSGEYLGAEPRILKAYDDRLIIAVYHGNSGETQRILEYSLESNTFVRSDERYSSVTMSDSYIYGWEPNIFKNGYFWWLHIDSGKASSRSDGLFVVQMDPNTFEQTLIKVE